MRTIMLARAIQVRLAITKGLLGLCWGFFCLTAGAQTPFNLTYPAAGALVVPGQPVTVQWTGGDPSWSVDVQLLDAALNQVVATVPGLPNNGSLAWTFPTMTGALKTCGRTYRFYVQNAEITSWAYGEFFTTPVCPLELVAPAAGAVVIPGQPVTVQWTGGEPSWSIDVQLLNAANQVVAGVSAVPNTGSLVWDFPMTIGGINTCGRSYRFYVQNSQRTNWAYGAFVQTPPCPFNVYSPSASDVLQYGQPVTVAWSGGDPAWSVNVYLLERAPGNYVRASVAANVANSGSVTWTFPADFPVGECGRTYGFYVENVQRTAWSYGANVAGPACPPPNTAPTANAGASQSIHAGDTVYLNGSGSFDDNTPTPSLGYAWKLKSAPPGSSAVLVGGNTATPRFTADRAGRYVVQLVVTDGGGLQSAPASVVVSSLNQVPTANAGPNQLVALAQTVRLNGTASSDPDNDPISYAWAIASAPAGSTARLNGANTAIPYLQPDVTGAYTVTLMVRDPYGRSAPDDVQIMVLRGASYVEQAIVSANRLVVSLKPSQVSSRGNQAALSNLLSDAVKAIQGGHRGIAISKLNEAISRTNGCERNGVPDGSGPGRDWVVDCSAQATLLVSLRSALRAIAR